MTSPDFREFITRARHGNWAPVWTTVPADLLTPVSAYLKLTAGTRSRSEPYSFLLESVEGGKRSPAIPIWESILFSFSASGWRKETVARAAVASRFFPSDASE